MTWRGKTQQFCSPQDPSGSVGFWACKDQSWLTAEDTQTHDTQTYRHTALGKPIFRKDSFPVSWVSPPREGPAGAAAGACVEGGKRRRQRPMPKERGGGRRGTSFHSDRRDTALVSGRGLSPETNASGGDGDSGKRGWR